MKQVPIEFMWYGVLNTLAGGDILKIDAITKLPAVACLNHLHYLKEMQKL